MAGPSDAVDAAAEFAALVDVLIPGDGAFPAASTVGAQARLAERLDRLAGPGAHRTLLDGLASAGGPLRDLDAAQRAGAVRGLEAAAPDLFEATLKAVYLSYYEHPSVHAAIRALGHPYHTRLLPEGYDVAPFDPATDRPSERRGNCRTTDEVRRVDLSGLDFGADTDARDGG